MLSHFKGSISAAIVLSLLSSTTFHIDVAPISAPRVSNRSGFAFILGGNIALTLMPGEVFEFLGDAVESTDPNSQF